MANLGEITLEEFEQYKGTNFSMRISDEVEVKLVLIEVKGLNTNRPDVRLPFSLIFESDQIDEYYEQGVFQVTHKELKAIDLFLVPIGPKGEKGGMLYEAIFN